MRKILCYILTLCLLCSGLLLGKTNAQVYENAEDALNDANKFLEDKLGFTGYYTLQSNGKDLNKEYAKKGTPAFSNKPIFVYGDQVEASIKATKQGSEYVKGKIYRAMGYTVEDSAFPNPDFPHDNDGYLADDKKWVKLPWEPGINKESYDGEDGSSDSRDLTDGALDLIKRWTNENTIFKPVDIETYTGGQRNFFAARADDVPVALKANFEDFLYIVQPPTEHSWGLGVAFYYWDNYFHFNYRTFLLKPYDMDKDLSAQFNSIPSGIVAGDQVLVEVQVNSAYERDLKGVSYGWEITKKDGTPLQAATDIQSNDQLEFAGSGNKLTGTVDIPGAKKETLYYASFKMPDSDVKVKFQINGDGTNPNDEETLLNNSIEQTIAIKVPDGEYDLDYNILSRKVKYPPASTPTTAQLSLPKGHWDGNATGSLDVKNQTADLFRDFNVTNNPPVNEPSTTIVRSPQINTTFYRTDFGDDPVNHKWLNWTPVWEPKTRSGSVTFDGSVSRPYTYTYHCSEENCPGHTRHRTAPGKFIPGKDTRTVKVRIYNGMETITPQTFQNKIDDNTTGSLQKNLYWTSEPYQFDVIRWMYHMDQDNNLYAPAPVDGQYKRTFTQQCSAVSTAKAASSMANDYAKGRAAAKNRNYTKSEYDKAVFASDIDFRNVDYPIKSGYYFNPTGTYTFTVETVTYKTTPKDTKEHQDLVNEVISSFRYESDLMYINSDKEPVNLQNQPLPKKGNSFGRRPAALTAKDPAGVNEIVLLNVLDRKDSESRYDKEVEEVQHTQDINGDTHQYWKEILEGYEESGTPGSNDNYKYREYVKDGQHIYKITEKTTVTIQINPGNKNVYTHAHMPDGKYYVKAWLGDIDLSKYEHEYKKLGVLKGITSLDEIEVSVKGSMYDDVN